MPPKCFFFLSLLISDFFTSVSTTQFWSFHSPRKNPLCATYKFECVCDSFQSLNGHVAFRPTFMSLTWDLRHNSALEEARRSKSGRKQWLQIMIMNLWRSLSLKRIMSQSYHSQLWLHIQTEAPVDAPHFAFLLAAFVLWFCDATLWLYSRTT